MQRIGATSAWSVLQGSALCSGAAANGGEPVAGSAYVGSLGPAGCDCIEVFRINGKSWTHIQKVPCQAPESLVIHPNRQFLYAANAVSLYKGLPRGTVEVFSIDRQSGALSALQRQTLSLSGIEPRSIAITPEGRYLVAAVYGGGAYNVLPIEQNGTLGGVVGIFKELGCGVHPERQAAAHPHTVMFDTRGRFVLASDLGCDQLSVFVLNVAGELQRISKMSVAPGSGPGAMVLHPRRSLLYVMHELRPSISCHLFSRNEGVIEQQFQSIPLPGAREHEATAHSRLTIDSSGMHLYASSINGITVWAIDPASGSLSLEHQGGNADALHLASPVSLALNMTVS